VQNPNPGNAPQATRNGVGEALAREFIFIAIRKSCHITSASGMRDFSCLGRVRLFFHDHLAVGQAILTSAALFTTSRSKVCAPDAFLELGLEA
jgi:hypothetical protein